ncbi:MAG: hypothetical protein KKA07_15670 [Bacteroidetes bacterium]|nr:hypothetical protein [Bacteroidota bacterium]MBU1720502.1 hypothetical protein [Bacteroidota bacterium]
MRNYMPHLESSLQKEISKLLTEIKSVLTASKKIKTGLDALLPRIFNVRIKAIKWIIEEERFDISEMFEEVYPQMKALQENPRLEILAENIMFSLRCNKRVVDALIGTGGFSADSFAANKAQLPIITYGQLLATLAYGIPNDETAQKIIDWVNSSLYIEFVILSAVIINDEKLIVSDKSINELAFLVADAAQEYSALATELGIFKPRLHNHFSFETLPDNTFVKEQKYLADFGITDFANNF